MPEKIAFITLTNDGYLPFTLNCIESARAAGLQEVVCYCIGKQCYDEIVSRGGKAISLGFTGETDAAEFRGEKWADIVVKKFDIIHQNLLKSDFVCITDGDIVFRNKNVLAYCRENILENDILIQNDSVFEGSSENLCSGFMFIRSNEETRKFFDPDFVVENSNIVPGWGDQLYVNSLKEKVSFGVLPLKLFPNGKYFYRNFFWIRPYLIHFNWRAGARKARRMFWHGQLKSRDARKMLLPLIFGVRSKRRRS